MPSFDSETRPRVLVTEKISQDGLDLLRGTATVEERRGLSPAELAEIIADYEALIVRSETKVTSELLLRAANMKVVAHVETATKQGVIVVNSPSGNIRAAAEHTIALLMATARHIPDACSSLKGGKWDRGRFVGTEVKGKTLGIIGVARMANGLEMKVIATDPYASPEIAESNNVTLMPSLPEVLKNCDFLTIHTPLIASTRGMISKMELESMKKGSRILNVARGGMIDEAALLEALESGHIAGAGVDVFTTEPPIADGTAAKLLVHPRVVATPHLGASTVEAQENVALDVCDQVLEILRGGLPRAAVNAPIILPEEYRRLQPFVELVERMGHLYTQHYQNPYQTFDLIYEGEICNITNTKPLYASLVRGLTKEISSATGINIVNANIVARERGIIINEQYSRESGPHTYSSLVTLRARPTRLPSQDRDVTIRAAALTTPAAATAPTTTPIDQHVISGYCSDTGIVISRLGRFATNFIPKGTLLICHNYDSPGKIGVVGSVLGRAGVNIKFMTVAPLTPDTKDYVENEALMILGLDGEVGGEELKQLGAGDGFLSAMLIKL
ncbi:MAG: hypothetical protein M1840_007932 [Geoglossum simile]|nr:MAG: hypothetical protein M1840_007932 [Geoglossum simile]